MRLIHMQKKYSKTLRPAFNVAMLAGCIALCSSSAWAKTWRINLRDANLATFVTEVADITGKNFVLDPRVNGTVTVISNTALTQDEVYRLFLNVMNVNGVVAIESGNVIKLVPDANAKQVGVPYSGGVGAVNAPKRVRYAPDQIITRVLSVENGNPSDLVNTLRPLLSPSAHMANLPETKSIIVSDRAQNIEQLEKMLQDLDAKQSQDFEFVTLYETQPSDIMDGLQAMLGSTGGLKGTGLSGSVVADKRNNRIIVKGDAKARQQIKKLIKTFDVKPAKRLGGIRVFRLKNANAKDMATTLQNLVNSRSTAVGASSLNLSGSSSSTSTGNVNQGSVSSFNPTSTSSGFNGTSGLSGTSQSGQDGVSIFADESLNAVIVKAPSSLMAEVESAIEQLDIRRTQVLIQAAIVEVSGDNSKQLGVQWAFGNPNSGYGTISFANAGPSASTLAKAALSGSTGLASVDVSGMLFGAGKSEVNADGQRSFYGAILQALATDNQSNLLSAPYVTTLDNQEANLLVGENIPIVTGTTSGTTGSTNSVSRQDVGISLKVRPRIGEKGTIALEVEQEVSSVLQNTAQFSAAKDIVTSKRKITTTVLADNQQVVVLGGLMKDDQSTSGSRVPGLSRIPLLGGLFRARSNSYNKKNLLVFLQPTILKDAADVTAEAEKRYAQVRTLDFELAEDGYIKRRLPTRLEQLLEVKMTLQPMTAPAAVPAPVYYNVPQAAPRPYVNTQQPTAVQPAQTTTPRTYINLPHFPVSE